MISSTPIYFFSDMMYDLSNPLQREQFKLRVNKLYGLKSIVDLTEKRPTRSLPQNAYLHLILGYFATQTGVSLEWAKREYFKKLCNPQIFIADTTDPVTGKAVRFLRSSAELNTEEMTMAIERFRNWSAAEADIYLPDANEKEMLMAAQVEVERAKKYL